ncbi:MAG: hypothetical protein OSJ62_05400 [Lachnospiraceae bacterium]|nr:hypothetical protein [Lachnospiraceae bacterium]
MNTFKRITALLLAATLTLSLCTAIIPAEPAGEYGEEGIAPCDESDLGEVDYW